MPRMLSTVQLTILALLFCSESLDAQAYQVERVDAGPMRFALFGVWFNEGSSLRKESILLNHPSAPVTITAVSGSFSYEDRRYRFESSVHLEVSEPITAVQVRHVLYDAFGDHQENLAMTEIRDLSGGSFDTEGVWNILRESVVVEHLTTAIYVTHVRLQSGRVWSFDRGALVTALRGLDLEGRLEDADEGSD